MALVTIFNAKRPPVYFRMQRIYMNVRDEFACIISVVSYYFEDIAPSVILSDNTCCDRLLYVDDGQSMFFV